MKLAKVAAATLIAAATLNPAPSMAFSLGKIVKSVGSAVTHPGRTVTDAGKAVANVVTHPARTAKDVGQAYMKVARPVGNAVGKYYDAAGAVAKRVPILKEAAPLAKEAAKIARSKAGQIGFGIASGTALAGGGVAALKYVGTAGGAGAAAAYYGHKGYNMGAKEVKHFKQDVQASAH